jgi:hypothetical protein
LSVFLGACGDSTAPTPSPSDQASFDGSFDPSDNSFLLSRIQVPGSPSLKVDLRASNIRFDNANSTVSIDVVVVNRSGLSLYPPAIIWLEGFVPAGVTVVNPDIVPPWVGPIDPGIYGFDYSNFLGSDGVLLPDESTQWRTWVIHDPDLASFSFVARAEFDLTGQLAFISGTTFHDSNYDGIRQRGEGPLDGAIIHGISPSGKNLEAIPDEMGHYRIAVTEPGLYRLQLDSLLDCVASLVDCPMCYTTERVRQIFLSVGEDGKPKSFVNADFGAVPGPCPGTLSPTQLTRADPDSLRPQDYFRLLDGTLAGNTLTLHVGFSGCSFDHEFTLFAGLPFKWESGEAHTWLRLIHDDHGELCDAWFERTLSFDLQAVRDAYLRSYGEPGPVVLELLEPNGQITQFRLEP